MKINFGEKFDDLFGITAYKKAVEKENEKDRELISALDTKKAMREQAELDHERNVMRAKQENAEKLARWHELRAQEEARIRELEEQLKRKEEIGIHTPEEVIEKIERKKEHQVVQLVDPNTLLPEEKRA